MANQSILAAFERKKQHIMAKLNDKADKQHGHKASDLRDAVATVIEVKAYLNI